MTKARVWAGSLLAAWLVLALGVASSASAQSRSTESAARSAEPSAAPAEQPRRRDRRRNDDAAAPAAAPATDASASATAAANEPKLICKNIKPIGSRVARRICGTEEQWAADNARTSADADESMRQMRGRSGITGGSSSGPASLGQPSFGR